MGLEERSGERKSGLVPNSDVNRPKRRKWNSLQMNAMLWYLGKAITHREQNAKWEQLPPPPSKTSGKENDFGVTINLKLSPENHVNGTMRSIWRHGWGQDPQKITTPLISVTFLYTATVWCSHWKKLINKLEKVRGAATKSVFTCSLRSLSYEESLRKLKLFPHWMKHAREETR